MKNINPNTYIFILKADIKFKIANRLTNTFTHFKLTITKTSKHNIIKLFQEVNKKTNIKQVRLNIIIDYYNCTANICYFLN